jgi:hypothetical protein
VFIGFGFFLLGSWFMVQRFSASYCLWCYYFVEQRTEGDGGALGHNAIASQSKLVPAGIAGRAQLGISQPIGSPIKTSQNLGFSLAFIK